MRLEDGSTSVKISGVEPDPKAFKSEYPPGHPAADPTGYVKLPNVDSLVEVLDFKAAQRAYEANLNVIDNSHTMEKITVDLLNKR